KRTPQRLLCCCRHRAEPRGGTVRVSDVLRTKGTDVFTVHPDTPVREFLDILVERRIGACVLSSDGATIAGMVSERDIATGLARRGADLLGTPVSAIASVDVHTVDPEATLDEVMRLMTE